MKKHKTGIHLVENADQGKREEGRKGVKGTVGYETRRRLVTWMCTEIQVVNFLKSLLFISKPAEQHRSNPTNTKNENYVNDNLLNNGETHMIIL